METREEKGNSSWEQDGKLAPADYFGVFYYRARPVNMVCHGTDSVLFSFYYIITNKIKSSLLILRLREKAVTIN